MAAPAGASAAATIHWDKPARIERAVLGGIDTVSCATARLCVTGDESGQLLWTTNPTGGSRFWRGARIDPGNAITAISCPTVTFCAAVDRAGNVMYSTNPTGGATRWSKPVRIDLTQGPSGGYVGFSGISCPTATLCVAVDNAANGNIVYSTNPVGGAKAWTTVPINGTTGGTLTSISCRTATLCVAAGTQHYYSTSPAGGAAAWHPTGGPPGGGVYSSIFCTSTIFCIGVGYGNGSTGMASTTVNPRGDATTWTSFPVVQTPPIQGAGLLDTVSCSTKIFCVALDTFDNAYTTTTPTTGVWVGPTPIRPKSAAIWSSLSCVLTLCVAVDSSGVETTGVIKG